MDSAIATGVGLKGQALLEYYLRAILQARVYDVAHQTPLSRAPFLSKRLANQVLIKREDLQPVFSFKIRGAYNKLASLPLALRQQGVVAASAGNHAQGLAFSAQHLGVKACIVMPRTTPAIKVAGVKNYGAEVMLHGDTFDEAFAYSQQLVAERGYTYIHPYDDPMVIAGQGTVGMEILRQTQELDAVFVPVGGGGLMAGMAAYIRYLRPDVKIIGVESEESACLHAALAAGERVILPEVGIFADGVAVAQIGLHTWELCREFVDEVVLVNTDEICAAIKDIFEDTRSVTEPSGALSIAGLKKYAEREQLSGQTLVAINSGANMNFDRFRYIAERTEIGEKREILLAVTIPEQPGSFQSFCATIGKRNITEFNYRFSHAERAHIYVGLATDPSSDDRSELIQRLESRQYTVVDMTDNEMAKLHLRHMVGGRVAAVGSELLFRFQFPERPGALMRFLTQVGRRWNISLFHYRNHGAAYGRVLVAFQASTEQRAAIKSLLDETGYPYWDETENPAYRLFLE